jgi:hypothetical protein
MRTAGFSLAGREKISRFCDPFICEGDRQPRQERKGHPMIGIITIRERNQKTGRVEDIVDRAFDMRTDAAVIMPPVTPQELGASYDENSGLWMLAEGTPKTDIRARLN